MKDVQNELGISYPTAKKKLDELLLQLNLRSEEESEIFDMSLFIPKESSAKASDIVRSKLYENTGRATVYSVTGKPYIIRAAKDGRSFLCSELPIKPPLTYDVFDVIVDLLLREALHARAWGVILPLARVAARRIPLSVPLANTISKPLLGNMCLTPCLC